MVGMAPRVFLKSNATPLLPHLPQPTESDEEWLTHAPFSYTLTASSSPNHKARPKSLRKRIKTIARKSLLKEYTPQPKPSNPSVKTPPRPTMRMKDSDDYITARAANPRTGLISPSIAGTPRTPESLAEALKTRGQIEASPLQNVKARPALSRANESRKISGGHLQRWRANENGWVNEGLVAGTVASPRQSDASAGAVDITNVKKRPAQYEAEIETNGDRFVVHMPSAQEPQPYSYPGRTAKEIEAYEHYRSKARKTSGDGWDQRCVQAGGIRKTSAGPVVATGGARRVLGGEARRRISKEYAQLPLKRDITAIRHPIQSHELEAMEGVAAFAQYQSPRTPARKTSAGCSRPMMPMQYRQPIARKPPGASIPGCLADDSTQQLSEWLPAVNIRHPALAGLPMTKIRSTSPYQQQQHQQQRQVPAILHDQHPRKCSLECSPSPSDNGMCEQLSLTKPMPIHPSGFSHRASTPTTDLSSLDLVTLATQTYAHLRPTLACLLESGRQLFASLDITLPAISFGPFAVLGAPYATPQQKVDALRSLLMLGGQILAVLLAISIAWKLCVSIGQVLAVVLWPVVVPFRVVKWMIVGL